MKALALCGVGIQIIALVSCNFSAKNEETPLSTDSSAVELFYYDKGFELARDLDSGVLSTGAIIVPLRNRDGSFKTIPGTSLNARATCGVTFVSPHYAITAAHCVSSADVPDPASQPLTVQMFDARGVSPQNLPSSISGLFPNYAHRRLTESDGYRVTTFQRCYVKERCSYGAYNCPSAASGSFDVALIKCLDRPIFAPYVNIASLDNGNGPVEMYWFHEVLDMPVIDPASIAGASAEDNDHYNHYWFLCGTDRRCASGSKEQNYHYHPDNQLLPLHSVAWPDSTPRRRVAVLGNEVWTDLYGCHGSSGSGIMQRAPDNSLELLGPVSRGGVGWSDANGDLLCQDISRTSSGQRLMAYPNIAYTQRLSLNARIDPEEGMSEWVAWWTAVQGI